MLEVDDGKKEREGEGDALPKPAPAEKGDKGAKVSAEESGSPRVGGKLRAAGREGKQATKGGRGGEMREVRNLGAEGAAGVLKGREAGAEAIAGEPAGT